MCEIKRKRKNVTFTKFLFETQDYIRTCECIGLILLPILPFQNRQCRLPLVDDLLKSVKVLSQSPLVLLDLYEINHVLLCRCLAYIHGFPLLQE